MVRFATCAATAALLAQVACMDGAVDSGDAADDGSGIPGPADDDAPPQPPDDAPDDDQPVPRPDPPDDLRRWIVGDPADAVVSTRGSGLVLMGGGVDVRDAFDWQRDRINGGDVVVLRTSGRDGYNDYLFDRVGGADSVETLRVDTRALADDPYVVWVLEHAEAIFLAGGDQATYVDAWTGTGVQRALQAAWSRGATLGGTSAGCAVLGQFAFSAESGSVTSGTALSDPFARFVTLRRDFAASPVVSGFIADSHFATRDRMGRLIAFLARIVADGWSEAPRGLGVDDGTAVAIDETGTARVFGAGSVYLVAPSSVPAVARPGAPVTWSDIQVYELRAGDQFALPDGTPPVPGRRIDVERGRMSPANPY